MARTGRANRTRTCPSARGAIVASSSGWRYHSRKHRAWFGELLAGDKIHPVRNQGVGKEIRLPAHHHLVPLRVHGDHVIRASTPDLQTPPLPDCEEGDPRVRPPHVAALIADGPGAHRFRS